MLDGLPFDEIPLELAIDPVPRLAGLLCTAVPLEFEIVPRLDGLLTVPVPLFDTVLFGLPLTEVPRELFTVPRLETEVLLLRFEIVPESRRLFIEAAATRLLGL